MGWMDLFGGKGRKDRFAERVMARLQKLGWPHPTRYDAAAEVIMLGGRTGGIDLELIRRECASYPRPARDAALDEFLEEFIALESDPTFDQVADQLTPLLRSRRITEAMQFEPIEDPRADFTGAWRPLGDYLAIHVAINRARSFRLVTTSMLRDWDQTFDEVLALALNNLREASALSFQRQQGGFLTSTAVDGNDLARLLLPEQFGGLQLSGAPVVVAAARNCLTVAGSDDPVALEAMAKALPGILDEHPNPIGYAPLVLKDGQWRPFDAPANLYGTVALQALQQAQDYEQQREIILGRLEREGRSADVAPIWLMPTPEGVRSLALWTTPASLLPRADQIVIRRAAGDTVVRDWADVEAACGGFAMEPSTALPYAVVTDWPSPEETAAIEAAPEPAWAKGKGIGVVNGRLTMFG